MRFLIAVMSIVMFVFAACANGGHATNAVKAESSPVSTVPAVEELPLPSVPSTLTAPEERAAYIVSHFWDAMDFGDTIRSHNQDFMEQNFANYISLFPYTDNAVLATCVSDLLRKAQADEGAYNLLADIADKYLYDPESPMLNEEYYILFLDAITGSDYMDKTRRSKSAYQLEDASKNRRGHKATDFEFVDSKGRKSTLYADADGHSYRLVIFYDPECEHCEETIEFLKGNQSLKNAVADGKMKVIAVYADGDESVWEGAKDSLPAEWTNSYSPDGAIEGEELYVLRAMPTLYVIAPDNTVALKDPSDRMVVQFIEEALK